MLTGTSGANGAGERIVTPAENLNDEPAGPETVGPVWLPVEQLHPHPHNPRIVVRQDVVDGIARQIAAAGRFDPAHALLVRPFNGGYQILSGHHRALATGQAGLERVPCWVRELDDADAFMALVLANAQGELSPLERGLHALEYVARGYNKRGGGHGLKEYAPTVGLAVSKASELRSAAAVYVAIKNQISDIGNLLKRAYYLSEISKAPEVLWPVLVRHMLLPGKDGRGWSVKDAQHWVGRVGEFPFPHGWDDIFLPFEQVIDHYLDSQEFSPRTVERLVAAAETVCQRIET